MKNPSKIRNKVKRTEVYAKYKQQKKKLKKQLRTERVKEVEALGEQAPPKQIPRTIENTRDGDETMVKADDDEILGDEKDDEFARYYQNLQKPKLMITTRPKCSGKLFPLIGDLMQMIPNAFYYPRGMLYSPSTPAISKPLDLDLHLMFHSLPPARDVSKLYCQRLG